MAFKLDIFQVLGSLDKSKGDVYASLTDGTSDAGQIVKLNEFANPYIFSLGKHPHLLARLLQVSSTKTSKRYGWLGIKSKKKNAMAHRAVQEYYGMSSREVKLLNPFPLEAEILQMADELGWDKDEVTKLKKEYKDG